MQHDVYSLEGKEVSYYRFLRRVGKGGQACVYKAEAQIVPKMPVAIKMLLEEYSRSKEMRARLHQEALIQCRLVHPNIVRTLDFLDEDGLLGVVMEWVEGEDLKSYARKQKYLDIEDIARIFLPLLDAVAYAHEHEIIHRDIKPANIFLSGEYGQEVPKLLDFGIAKLLHDSRLDTQQGQILGTAAYISPEQIMDQKDSPSMDIYSLGVTLYQISTGRLPFEGNSVQMLHGHCDLEPMLPSAHRRNMSQALERTILTALQKDPQRRFPDCRSFRDSLIEALDYTTPFQGPLGMRQHTPASLPSLQAIVDGKIPLPSSSLVAVSSSSEGPPAIFPHLAKLLAKTQSNPIHAGSQQAKSDEAPTDPHHAHPRRCAGNSIPQPHSLEQRFELAQQMPEEAATVQALPTFSMHEIAQMMASQGNSAIPSETASLSEDIPRTSYDVAQTSSLAETTSAPHSIYSQPTMRVSDELLATYAEDEQPTFAKGQTSPKRQQRHDVLLGMFGGLGLAAILFLVLWFFLR